MNLSTSTLIDETAQSELLAAAAGGAAPELARQLMLQAAGAETPGDPLAAMLAVQMAAVHEAALRLLKRAGACGDETETQALYSRQAARLLHLFQRQARTLERRRATAQLEAQAAACARREAAELRRRRELEARMWDEAFDEFDEDDFEEDEAGAEEAGTGGAGDGGIDGGAAGGRAAGAADRDPAARDAAAQAGIAETSDQLSALFARHAAAMRAQAREAAGRNGAAADAAEEGGRGERAEVPDSMQDRKLRQAGGQATE